jgi:hypothetical protein
MEDRLRETPEPHDRHSRERRSLWRIGRRQKHLPSIEAAAELCDGEAAAHGTHGAVEPQLAADQAAL